MSTSTTWMELDRVEINFGRLFKSARANAAWVDVETEKFRLERPLAMANGELLKSAWRPIAVGLGFIDANDDFILRLETGWSEPAACLSDVEEDELVYSATREFDEMVMKGRFTNARRAHFSRPLLPVYAPERLGWVNIRKQQRAISRADFGVDIESRAVPSVFGRDPDLVLVHLARDVLWLASVDPLVERVGAGNGNFDKLVGSVSSAKLLLED